MGFAQLLEFLVYFFGQIWEIFSCYIFKGTQNPTLFLFAFWDSDNTNVRSLCISQVPDTVHFCSIFSLLFRWGNFYFLLRASLPILSSGPYFLLVKSTFQVAATAFFSSKISICPYFISSFSLTSLSIFSCRVSASGVIFWSHISRCRVRTACVYCLDTICLKSINWMICIHVSFLHTFHLHSNKNFKILLEKIIHPWAKQCRSQIIWFWYDFLNNPLKCWNLISQISYIFSQRALQATFYSETII